MQIITPKNLDFIAKENIDTLVEFDNKGLLLGPNETLEEYCKRLGTLKENIQAMKHELKENGRIELLGTHFSKDEVIPHAIFQTAQTVTRTLYHFDIDWVPGFFANHRMGILFAGCALYSRDDFFAVFIIRKIFKLKERWIIYSRTELMAHELCHVAHIGFQTRDYEEIFAYQTSESAFRKILGGMLRTTTDTYMILTCVIVLLIAQILNVILRPPSLWHEFPMPLIYGISTLGFCLIFFRYLYFWHRFKNAQTNIMRVFGRLKALPVLFRCDGSEIKEISKLNEETDLRVWLSYKLHSSVRWRIIVKKFLP